MPVTVPIVACRRAFRGLAGCPRASGRRLGQSRCPILSTGGSQQERFIGTLCLAYGSDVRRTVAAYSWLMPRPLDQAAAYAADPEVTATLIEAAASSPGQLNHALSRAEQDRDRANRNGRPLEELTVAGVTVIDPPEHGSTATAVHRQTHGGQPLDPAATAAVPGMPPTCTPASTASPWTSCTCAPTPAGTGTATAAPTTNPSPARRGGR